MDDYISLVEAWVTFCEKKARSELFDPLKSRPHNGPGRHQLVRDEDTLEWRPVPILDGRDYELGRFNTDALNSLRNEFAHLIALKLKLVTFEKTKGGEMRPASFKEWWGVCEPKFFDYYRYSLASHPGAHDTTNTPNLFDGGPKSWDAVRPATSFPILIQFERDAFEVLSVVKRWSEPDPRSTPATAIGKAECVAWLVKLRKDGPQPKGKDEMRGEAAKSFGVGPRQFNDCWGQAALQEPSALWGKAGRRKKS